MIYGYARVSTIGQARNGNSLADQETALRSAGCEEIYHDHLTGTKMDRPEFTELIGRLRSGDRLVVTKLDRFARTAADGIAAIRRLLERGVSVHILNMGLIDNTPTGRLMVTMLLGFAEFERDMIVERTMAGKEVAKATRPDWREGRKAIKLDETEFQKFREKQKRQEMTVVECCEKLGISRRTWYNKIKKA
jgi:DNA invertase Pin-like site-specific DNA recombinase